MATMQEAFQNAGEDMLNIAGVDATFIDTDLAETACRVKLKKDVNLQPSGYESQVYAGETTIKALLHILGKQPERGERFTIDGTIYQVEEITENNGIFVTCAVKEITE